MSKTFAQCHFFRSDKAVVGWTLSEGCSTQAKEDIERPIVEVLAEHLGEARSFALFVVWILLACGCFSIV